MKQSLYDEIHKAIDSRDRLLELARQHPGLSYNTLLSIYSRKYQEHTRKTMWRHRKPEVRTAYYEKYKTLVSNASQDSAILVLAEEFNLAPCLMARIILEGYVRNRTPDIGDTKLKNLVSAFMQHPEDIEDERLLWEVGQCIKFDDNYSPLVEKVRHTIGRQYEYILQEKLHSLGIAFRGVCDPTCEDELREQQFPKTPDIMLDVPLGVGSQVVRWIESKASFGDRHMHETNKQQFFGYVNRYGPGLVIYWFGFIDELDDIRDKGVMIMDDFPEDIVFLRTSVDQPPVRPDNS